MTNLEKAKINYLEREKYLSEFATKSSEANSEKYFSLSK